MFTAKMSRYGKIGNPPSIGFALPLTPKQEKFCVAYVKTSNASEAYRQSYDAKNMNPNTINRKAKDLIDNGKIAARVRELQAPAAKKVMISLESHLIDLERIRRGAETDRKWSAAAMAEMGRAKAAGIIVEKHEHTGKDGAPIALTATTMMQGIDLSKLNNTQLKQLEAAIHVIEGFRQDRG